MEDVKESIGTLEVCSASFKVVVELDQALVEATPTIVIVWGTATLAETTLLVIEF